MIQTTLDPLDRIPVFVSIENLAISFKREKGMRVRRRTDGLAAPEVLTEGEGFRIYIFDDRKRMRGFLDALPVLEGVNAGFAWSCDSALPGGLCAVALRFAGDTVEKWIDLRGENTEAS
jgi:hypothetical protein